MSLNCNNEMLLTPSMFDVNEEIATNHSDWVNAIRSFKAVHRSCFIFLFLFPPLGPWSRFFNHLPSLTPTHFLPFLVTSALQRDDCVLWVKAGGMGDRRSFIQTVGSLVSGLSLVCVQWFCDWSGGLICQSWPRKTPISLWTLNTWDYVKETHTHESM